MKRFKILPAALIGLAVTVFLIAGCNPGSTGDIDKEITPGQLYDLIAAGADDYVLVDVRTADEYSGDADESYGHIPSAINRPVAEISAWDVTAAKAETGLDTTDLDMLIVVYCKAGGRAATAKAALDALGFTDVRNFGGITRWIDAGYTALKGTAAGGASDL